MSKVSKSAVAGYRKDYTGPPFIDRPIQQVGRKDLPREEMKELQRKWRDEKPAVLQEMRRQGQ